MKRGPAALGPKDTYPHDPTVAPGGSESSIAWATLPAWYTYWVTFSTRQDLFGRIILFSLHVNTFQLNFDLQCDTVMLQAIPLGTPSPETV